MLDEMPEPTAEEPEKFPGGVDSIADQEKYGAFPDTPLTPDLHPEDNPATDTAPEELSEPEDAEQEGDEDVVEADTPA